MVRGTVGKGVSATVSAAKHRFTGETAAAKFLVRNVETWPRAAAEMQLYDLLPDHVRIINTSKESSLTTCAALLA